MLLEASALDLQSSIKKSYKLTHMKTRQVLILIALAVSVGFNVYSVSSGEPEVSPCDNSRRYTNETSGGGSEISAAGAKGMVSEYRANHVEDKTEYKTTGFVMSKRIFDELFKNPTANALTLDLVSSEGQLNLVVKSTSTNKTGIDARAGSGVFVLQSFCPDDCSAW